MTDAKTQADRVAEWRASGLSAAKFVEGRDFSAHQLWNWAAKLRKREEATTAAPAIKPKSVRLARVMRVARRAPEPRTSECPLSVEVLGIRVEVRAGFDRATFSAVLDEIEMRRARSGGQ